MPINLALGLAHLAIHLYQFFILPLWILPASPWWALSLLPLAALNNPLWSLLHETIHGSFHPAARFNRLAGRGLAILFGAPWRILAVGHLLHHRFNRTALDRPEAYDPARAARAAAALGYYYQLLLGLYLSQILSPLAFILRRRWLVWARRRYLAPESFAALAALHLMRPQAIREIRFDGAAIGLWLAASLYGYGAYWWLALCLLAGRAACISFLDYIYHYGTRTDQVSHARNLRLPRPFAWLLLHFNLHGVHHRHPRLPWRALPQAFRREGHGYAGSYGPAALAQLRGPIALERLRALDGDA